MCVSPISIKNPSYRSFHRGIDDMPLPEFADKHTYVHRLHQNTTSQYIQVPCGHCIDCKRKRQMQFVQRSQVSSLRHHVVFFTLTYKPEMLPEFILNYLDQDGNPSVFRFKYADVRDLQCMFKRIRKDNAFGRPFKYLFVTEYGGTTHRPHFHGLLFLEPLQSELLANGDINPLHGSSVEMMVTDVLKKYYSRNISGSTKKPVYEPLCSFKHIRGRAPYDVQYVYNSDALNYGFDHTKNVSYYVTKYTMKEDSFPKTLWKELNFVYHHRTSDDFNVISNLSASAQARVLTAEGTIPFGFYWNLLRPKVVASKFLGLQSDFEKSRIREDIESSIKLHQPSFTFTDPVTGVLSLLSPYFKKRLLSVDDVDRLTSVFPEDEYDNNYDNFRYFQSRFSSAEIEASNTKSRINRGKRIQKQINVRDDDYYVDSPSQDRLDVPDFDTTLPDFGPSTTFETESPDYVLNYDDIKPYMLRYLKNSAHKHIIPDIPIGVRTLIFGQSDTLF